MSNIIERLSTSLRIDAHNGDSHERSVFASQAREALNEMRCLTAELATLRERLDEAERDAARYRWLRAQPASGLWGTRNPGFCFLKAGWERCGRTKGGLIVLERRR